MGHCHRSLARSLALRARRQSVRRGFNTDVRYYREKREGDTLAFNEILPLSLSFSFLIKGVRMYREKRQRAVIKIIKLRNSNFAEYLVVQEYNPLLFFLSRKQNCVSPELYTHVNAQT